MIFNLSHTSIIFNLSIYTPYKNIIFIIKKLLMLLYKVHPIGQCMLKCNGGKQKANPLVFLTYGPKLLMVSVQNTGYLVSENYTKRLFFSFFLYLFKGMKAWCIFQYKQYLLLKYIFSSTGQVIL
jgi:hypothetical protein